MRGINRVIFGGNVGNDPEVRYTQGGTAVTNLRIASNAKEKKGDEYVDVTTWMSVVVFGKSAEFCGQYLKKGSSVYIEGRLRQKEWEDKSGNKRTDIEIVADRIDSLDRREKSGAGGDDDTPF